MQHFSSLEALGEMLLTPILKHVLEREARRRRVRLHGASRRRPQEALPRALQTPWVRMTRRHDPKIPPRSGRSGRTGGGRVV